MIIMIIPGRMRGQAVDFFRGGNNGKAKGGQMTLFQVAIGRGSEDSTLAAVFQKVPLTHYGRTIFLADKLPHRLGL